MHFGFTLDLPDIDLSNIDLLDTHLDFLDTDIHNKYFFCLQNVLETSAAQQFFIFQDVSKNSSRCLQEVFARRL